MTEYCFSVIVPTPPMTYDQTLDATDALGHAGCTDASTRGHDDAVELMFERAAESLQVAIASAIAHVENAGFRVSKVELQRETIPI